MKNHRFKWLYLIEKEVYLIVIMSIQPSSERSNELYILAVGDPNGKKYKYGYIGKSGDITKHSGFVCDDISEKMLELSIQELKKWIITRQIMES